jgi:undecaprenyl-diphosphatase
MPGIEAQRNPLGQGVRGQAAIAATSAAIAAYLTVRFLVNYLKTKTPTPFAVYCLIFGTAMLIYNA